MNIPQKFLYTKTHEWVKIEDNKATIGITDYAQSALGDIVFVELPEIGKKIEQFKELGIVESVKSASSIYTPMSGKIIEVNQQIINIPELINKSPYDQAWFVIIEIENIEEKNNLLSNELYEKEITK